MREVLEVLAPHAGERWLDLTVGAGGHASALLDAVDDQSELAGIDRDEEILGHARSRLAGRPATLVHGFFGDVGGISRALEEAGAPLPPFDAVLADIGVSSLQLDDAARGFSFRSDGPLDMRMDHREVTDAREYVNATSVDELTRVIKEYGEERFAGRVASAIDRARRSKPIETTGELADIVRGALPRGKPQDKDPSTRTFQAIRIAINRELDALDHLLSRFGSLLAPGGRFAVISFHSLEDRRVKQAFRTRASEGDYELLTKGTVTASADEVAENPRARSARLRAIRRKREGER